MQPLHQYAVRDNRVELFFFRLEGEGTNRYTNPAFKQSGTAELNCPHVLPTDGCSRNNCA